MSPQVTVRVVDVYGRPQKGVKVEVHRADLVSVIGGFTYVTSAYTDENGVAFINGLWAPWKYAFIGIREEDDFQTSVEILDIMPFTEYEIKLKGTGPPHKYRLIINCKFIPSGFLEDFINALKPRIEGIYPVDINNVYISDNNVIVEFTIHHPIPVWAIALIMIAVAVIFASVFGFMIIKEFPKAIPSETWWLIGVGIASAGLAYLVSTIKK